MLVLRVQYMLTKRFGFKDEDIIMLLDDSADPNAWPTGNNMRYHMRQLVAGAQSGDSLLFHFSGETLLLLRHESSFLQCRWREKMRRTAGTVGSF